MNTPLIIALLTALAQSPQVAGATAGQAEEAEETGEAAGSAPATPSAPLPYAPSEPSSVRPFELPPTLPGAPIPYDPGALDRIPDKPVTVDAYRRSYEGPPDAREQLYQAGIARNADIQQSRMGPLDGAWTVRSEAGAPLMALMLHDTGRPGAEVEGAWRRFGPGGRAAGSGLLLSVRRDGRGLVLQWYERAGASEPSTMRLDPQADGRWVGAVEARDVRYPVIMGR